MRYFKLNSRLEVVAIADDMPEELKLDSTLWYCHPSRPGRGWLNRSDISDEGLMFAQAVADSATEFTGELHIVTDDGEWVTPRYDVMVAPRVGDEVSKAFNGDYYPVGTIARISASLRVITTSTGDTFYRRKQRGAWVNGGTWSLVPGHINRWNPEF